MPEASQIPPQTAPETTAIAARLLCTDLAGLRNQALGLAEAAGLAVDLRPILLRGLWAKASPILWPAMEMLSGCDARAAALPQIVAPPLPRVVIGAGGAGARITAALRAPDVAAVAIQHPRMAARKFDLIFAGRHDGIAGPNVIVTRTALHRVTAERLAAERARWAPVFAGLPRPLVAVLVGGSNGRYTLDAGVGAALAGQLAAMMQADRVGVMVTPSRRTEPAVVASLGAALAPHGGHVWDGTGENPYFGMLALADAIVATADSVSMVSEAVATAAPVLIARLPGRSARIGAFMDALVRDGRVRDFRGRFETWNTAPLDDTAWAGAELRRRLGL
jgi:uncharacterized protein